MNSERSMPLLPQVVIPVVSVQMVKKHKMARLLPNGLAITTNTSQKVSESLSHTLLLVSPSQPQEPTARLSTLSRLCFLSMSQYVFVSLLSRDSVYDMLRRVCTHLQVRSSGAGVRPERLLGPGLEFWDKAVGEDSPFLQHREQGQGEGSNRLRLSGSEAVLGLCVCICEHVSLRPVTFVCACVDALTCASSVYRKTVRSMGLLASQDAYSSLWPMVRKGEEQQQGRVGCLRLDPLLQH